MSLSSDRNKSLPQLAGPQLDPFDHRRAALKFIALLSSRSPGKHGHVFEVIIAKKRYALKIFRFFDADEELSSFDHLPDVPRDKLILQMDPFYSECRAYGQIIGITRNQNGTVIDRRQNQNGKIATFCHGHLSLPATLEAKIAKQFNIDDWQRPEEEYNLPVARRTPFRAIVKRLVSDSVPFSAKMIPRMLKDFRHLRRIHVYVRDVRSDNYLGGKLVDFSCAWTAPHILLSDNIRSWRVVETDLKWDLYQFDEMVKREGIVTWRKASPNVEYLAKLRQRRGR